MVNTCSVVNCLKCSCDKNINIYFYMISMFLLFYQAHLLSNWCVIHLQSRRFFARMIARFHLKSLKSLILRATKSPTLGPQSPTLKEPISHFESQKGSHVCWCTNDNLNVAVVKSTWQKANLPEKFLPDKHQKVITCMHNQDANHITANKTPHINFTY